ncbi:MAG: twin-arginine translocation signal domain-containing protein [Opitutae bacterium]|nr:twin-arginine translocation signal domain-containing protein [Opitutae bacterium]
MKPSQKPAPPAPALPRRDFLKAAAGLALGTTLGAHRILGAAERRRSFGANDRIRIGLIGCGDRGRNAHLDGIQPHAKAMNVEIVALCDPWSGRGNSSRIATCSPCRTSTRS